MFNLDPIENPAERRIREMRARMETRAAEAAAKAQEPPKPGASRFSTDAAIAWGRAQGWVLLDRERYDARLRRHHDLLLGADAMMESPEGVVLLQGAGRHERARHRDRFEVGGGEGRARRLGMRFVYLEFVRGNGEPVLTEWWA